MMGRSFFGLRAIAIALGGIGCAAPAAGVPITFAFVAEVTSIDDPNGLLAASDFHPSIGDPIVGSYTFDSATPPGPAGPSTNFYEHRGAAYAMVFEIAGTTFRTQPPDRNGYLNINVSNNDTGGIPSRPADQYLVFTNPQNVAGVEPVITRLVGRSEVDLGVLTSDALPLLPPDFSRFDALNRFNLLLYPNVNVDGRVLSLTLVPEPATFEIFSLGLIGLGLRRRRTSLRS